MREEQPRFAGWLLTEGRVAIRCRMDLSHRSMAAMWLAGFEEHPDEGGELCVVEVFGRSVTAETAEVGIGSKQVHDPDLRGDFRSPRIAVDVSKFHDYAVEWTPGAASFSLDGTVIHRTTEVPAYPMQIMIAVFDFPGWSTGRDDHLVPALEIDWIDGASGDAAGSRRRH